MPAWNWNNQSDEWMADDFYRGSAKANGVPVEDEQEAETEYQILDRIAEAALQELEANGCIEVLILKNDQVATWWSVRKQLREKERLEKERRQEEHRKREAALAKLTSEERELLGLAPQPTVVKRVRKMPRVDF